MDLVWAQPYPLLAHNRLMPAIVESSCLLTAAAAARKIYKEHADSHQLTISIEDGAASCSSNLFARIQIDFDRAKIESTTNKI